MSSAPSHARGAAKSSQAPCVPATRRDLGAKTAKLSLKLWRWSREGFAAEAELLDAYGARCLDSRAQVRFALAGEGRMIDNLGTPTGSRVVLLANGRARITVQTNAAAVLPVSSPGLAPAFLNLDGGSNVA
jgi:beta-galactosidase